MSMRPRLWSLNGLATELGRDRRTMGKILATTPPDGRLNGHAAWFLTTALDAVDDFDRPPNMKASDQTDAMLGRFVDRVVHWREMHSGPRFEWAIETAAENLGISIK